MNIDNYITKFKKNMTFSNVITKFKQNTNYKYTQNEKQLIDIIDKQLDVLKTQYIDAITNESLNDKQKAIITEEFIIKFNSLSKEYIGYRSKSERFIPLIGYLKERIQTLIPENQLNYTNIKSLMNEYNSKLTGVIINNNLIMHKQARNTTQKITYIIYTIVIIILVSICLTVYFVTYNRIYNQGFCDMNIDLSIIIIIVILFVIFKYNEY